MSRRLKRFLALVLSFAMLATTVTGAEVVFADISDPSENIESEYAADNMTEEVPQIGEPEETENIGLHEEDTDTKLDQVILAENVEKKYGCKSFYLDAVLAEGDGILTYESSDTEIAEIDDKGKVTVRGIGKATITITASETESYLETTLDIDITVSDDMRGPDVKITRLSGGTLEISWNKNMNVDGYQIRYSYDSLFGQYQSLNLNSSEAVSTTINGLAAGRECYVRIRSFKTVNGTTYYSVWRESANTGNTKYASATYLKKGTKAFELRTQTKQSVYGYDTLQGSCTDGKYAYYVMYNRKVERCKVAKVRLSDMKVIKVSKVLKIAHGNDMTYNSRQGYIVVTHTNVNPKRISIIDAKTLTIKKTIDVQIPSYLEGATSSQCKAIYGFAGIAYNSNRDQYAVLLRKSHDFIILNSSFVPVKYIKATRNTDYTYQGIDATDDYILVAQSRRTSAHAYNILSVYSWDGQYRSRVNVKKAYEIESIYHIGTQFYAGFYRAYYKPAYKYKIKKVKKKWKKVNGKWKYKYKKKKVKVKYNKLIRSNYIYKLDNL